MDRTYLRGDIYYAYFSEVVGSEQGGFRPVLIIQNDIGNEHSPNVIVAAITSKLHTKTKLPTHYFIAPETSGLKLPSIVLLEQIRTIDKKRLTDYIGRLNEQQMSHINYALTISLGIYPI